MNDTSLITTLVERWKPEADTFVMRCGEMIVTPEGVGYILGLLAFEDPLMGPPISNLRVYFQRNWFEPLTDEEASAALCNKGWIKFIWFHARYEGYPGDDPIRIAIHTCSVLFSTSSRNVVHSRYIC